MRMVATPSAHPTGRAVSPRTLRVLSPTTGTSKLHDPGCASREDDHAAERGSNEQGDAKRELAVEDQE